MKTRPKRLLVPMTAALLVVIDLAVGWLLLRRPITFLKVPTSDSKASASSLSRALK
jgi:hypothetical protein